MEQRRIENIERKQADAERTSDLHTEFLRELSKKSDTHTHMLIAERTDILVLQNNVATLQEDMKDAKADITAIKATQSDHGELLREQSKRTDTMDGKLDSMQEQLAQILMILQQKPSE